MFYQFNNFTGRLAGSSHMTPYFPLGPQPLSKCEPPKIIFEHKIAQETQVRPASQRRLVPGTNELYGEVPEALKKKMELFQRNNGVPIYLKGGPMDRVLFTTTAVLCVVGVLSVFRMVYLMSFPKKQ